MSDPGKLQTSIPVLPINTIDGAPNPMLKEESVQYTSEKDSLDIQNSKVNCNSEDLSSSIKDSYYKSQLLKRDQKLSKLKNELAKVKDTYETKLLRQMDQLVKLRNLEQEMITVRNQKAEIQRRFSELKRHADSNHQFANLREDLIEALEINSNLKQILKETVEMMQKENDGLQSRYDSLYTTYQTVVEEKDHIYCEYMELKDSLLDYTKLINELQDQLHEYRQAGPASPQNASIGQLQLEIENKNKQIESLRHELNNKKPNQVHANVMEQLRLLLNLPINSSAEKILQTTKARIHKIPGLVIKSHNQAILTIQSSADNNLSWTLVKNSDSSEYEWKCNVQIDSVMTRYIDEMLANVSISNFQDFIDKLQRLHPSFEEKQEFSENLSDFPIFSQDASISSDEGFIAIHEEIPSELNEGCYSFELNDLDRNLPSFSIPSEQSNAHNGSDIIPSFNQVAFEENDRLKDQIYELSQQNRIQAEQILSLNERLDEADKKMQQARPENLSYIKNIFRNLLPYLPKMQGQGEYTLKILAELLAHEDDEVKILLSQREVVASPPISPKSPTKLNIFNWRRNPQAQLQPNECKI